MAPGHRHGFTLVEILMVVTLIGLIAAFAVPKIDLRGYRVNGGVRSMSGLLGQAQRLAVTRQSNVNVIFVTATDAIRIHEDLNDNNVIDVNERVRTYPIGEGVTYGIGSAPVRLYAPAPISFTHRIGGLPELIFRRDGSASENGGLYLTAAGASNRATDARSIEVSRASGRVSWYRYTGSVWEKKF